MRTVSIRRPLDVHYMGRDISVDPRFHELKLHYPRHKVDYGDTNVHDFFYHLTKASRPDNKSGWTSYYSRPSGYRRSNPNAVNKRKPKASAAEKSLAGYSGKPSMKPARSNGSSRSQKAFQSRGTVAVQPRKLPSGSRKCLVKIAYTNLRGPAAAVSNSRKVAYIAREEATLLQKPEWEEATKNAPLYRYNADGTKVMLSGPEASTLLGEEGIIRIILSPEDRNVDLSEFTNRFMSKSFFRATGVRTDCWCAANHYNTDHPHVHILVSRADPRVRQEDREFSGTDGYIRFSRSYIRKGKAQSDAGRILTGFMGPRTDEEEKTISQGLVETRGLTRVDESIKKILDKNPEGNGYILTLDRMAKVKDKRTKALIRRRMLWLKRHTADISYDPEKRLYRVASDWYGKLQAQGHLKEMLDEKDIPEITEDRMKAAVIDDQYTKPYKGVITGFRISDEDPDRAIFTIEDEDGRIHIHEEMMEPDTDIRKMKGQEAEISRENGRKVPVIKGKEAFRRKGKGL